MSIPHPSAPTSQRLKAVEQHQAQTYSYAWQGNLYAAIEQLELAKQAGRKLLPTPYDRERFA